MLFLLGNKCDLDHMREVTIENILEFKENNQILYA
jgi:GTPase SAR1 family protein